MGKSIHFFGQPVYGQLIKSLDHDKIVEMSRKVNDRKCVRCQTKVHNCKCSYLF